MEKENFKSRFKNFITAKSIRGRWLKILAIVFCVAVIFSVPVFTDAFSDNSWLSELKDSLNSQKKQHARHEEIESQGSETSDTETSPGKSDDESSPEGDQSANEQSSDSDASGSSSSKNASAGRPSKGNSGDTSKNDSTVSAGSSDGGSNSGSTGNSGNSASSGGNSSGGSSSSSGSSSDKVWVPPVYKTVHHEAVYETRKVWVCNYCKEEFSSLDGFQVHKEANGG